MSCDLKAYYDSLYGKMSTRDLELELVDMREEREHASYEPDSIGDEIMLVKHEAALRAYRNRFCPICRREMIEGASVDEHHLVPKSLGGKVKIRIHRVCHRKIHSVFTERELQHEFNTVEALVAHDGMRDFIKWVAKKEPTFYASSEDTNRKR